MLQWTQNRERARVWMLGDLHRGRRMTTSFEQELLELKESTVAKLQPVLTDIIDAAVASLREDIKNPNLTSSTPWADAFMLRANQVGLALAQ